MTATEIRATLGNRIRVTFDLDIGGVATDPTTLRLRARARSGGALGPFEWTAAVPGTAIVKISAGRFRSDLLPTKAGLWDWRYEALDAGGLPLAATEGTLIMESRLVG